MRRASRRDDLLVLVLLLLALGLAAGVRFYALGAQSLWSDEGNSAALAARPLAQIARDAANDIHPPLYYALLHLWTRQLGNSEAALRSLSAVLGVVLVWVTAEIGRRMFGRATGLAAAFIAAIAPFQVYYSQEARMYILLALATAVSFLALWGYLVHEARRIEADGDGRPPTHWGLPATVALVISWTAGLYTHYFFPVIMAVQGVLFLVWLWQTRSLDSVLWRLLRWLLLMGLAVLAFAPWAIPAFRQIAGWDAPADRPTLVAGLAAVARQVTSGPQVLLGGATWGPWLLALLVAFGALPWPLSAEKEAPGGRIARLDTIRYVMYPAWVLAPIVAILALGLTRDAYLKFLIVASPAVALLLARAVLGPDRWLQKRAASRTTDAPPAARLIGPLWAAATLALIGGLSGAALARYFTSPGAARDDYRGLARYIAATGHAGDAVILDAPGQAEVFDYYYDGDLPVYPLPRQRPADPAATIGELEKLLDHQKVFAAYWGAQEADPAGIVEGWLDRRGYKTLDQWRGNVRLAVYQMPEGRPPDEETTDLDVRFGDAIALTELKGWDLTPSAGEVTQLQLNWRTLKPPDRRYKVFVQLLDARDQVIAQRDAEPVGGSRPTDSWQTGDEIVDNHGLLIPPGTPPGSYRRIIGLYDAETMERLRLPDGSDHLLLSPITVQRTAAPPALEALEMQSSQRFDFGGVSLLGHDHYKRGYRHIPETPLSPGDLLHLTFYWQANVAPRADWWMDLTLSDSEGKIVSQVQAPLAGETYPTRLWEQGEIVRGEHDLLLPPDLRPGEYRLSLALLPDYDTPAGTAYLGEVTVK